MMATRALASLVRLLRQSRLHHGSMTADGELLEHFISRGDGDAFEALVHRHGPMVLGVCRRILRNARAACRVTYLATTDLDAYGNTAAELRADEAHAIAAGKLPTSTLEGLRIPPPRGRIGKD